MEKPPGEWLYTRPITTAEYQKREITKDIFCAMIQAKPNIKAGEALNDAFNMTELIFDRYKC